MVYANIIGESLEQKANKLEVPLITHAEDSALGPSFQILMCGHTVLANKSSLIGNVGFTINPWMIKDFIAKWDIYAKFYTKG